MDAALLHRTLTWIEIGLAVVTVIALRFIVAPYGRHGRAGFGPGINTRAAWVLMELPTVALFVPIYLAGAQATELVPLVLLAFWLSHYLYRTFYFPFRIRPGSPKTALLIVASGALFNCLNAFINARQLSEFGVYPPEWLTDPRFLSGAALFVLGSLINRDADRTLRALRTPEDPKGTYRVPHGRLYEYVSCPNFLGEIIEWFGFSVMTWSLPGFAFFLYTAANVGPRALAHHAWYREKFPDYPKQRRALIPFLL